MASHPGHYYPTGRSAFSTSVALLAIFAFYTYYYVVRSHAAGDRQAAGVVDAGDEQVANIPYFVESDEFHSTLILNNNQTEEKIATVTFFNSDGKRWEHAPIRLKPRMVQRFAVSDLLKNAPSDFRSGNIQIVHHGLPFDVMEQITITSEDQRLSFESTRTAASDFVMSRLDGIYWVPDRETEAKVALTNVSTVKLKVTMIAGEKEEQISLRPRETRALNLREFIRDAKGQDSGTLVTLEHNGAPGALIATGFTLNARTGFSSNLTFADCGSAKSMTLAGAHIRLGPPDPSEGFPSSTFFRSPLLIANTMDKPVKAKLSIEYTIGGKPARVHLSPINLAPRQVKQVELAEELERRGITGLMDDAGVDLTYNGMPGTVIARLTSYDESKEYAFDVPIKDPKGGPSNGGYPWRLDGDYATVLHLKNTLDKEVTAIYKLIYEGGEYNPKQIKLAPFQTIAIDIRKLRDAQEKDLRGAVMPKDIETGKVVWLGLDPQFVMIGRAEVAKVRTGIASSFSCTVCECGQVYARDLGYQPYLSPSSLTVPTGASGQFFGVNEYMKTFCFNDYWGPVAPSGTPNWNSTNPAVATVSGQTITAVGPGTTTISANWSGDVVAYAYMCTPQYSGGGASATLTVTPPTIGALQASMPSTGGGQAGTFSTTNKSPAFATTSTTDIAVVFQSGSAMLTVSAQGINPTSFGNQLKWTIKRDTTDTVTTGLPTLSSQTGPSIDVTPSVAGNFNVICYYDKNGGTLNTYDAGEELGVLHLAVVRVTLGESSLDVPAVDFAGSPFGQTEYGVASQPLLMNLLCTVTLEGGGANRLIGVNKITIGTIQNLTATGFTINYPIPTPTPAAPGNVSGTGTENPGDTLPTLDGPNDNPTGASAFLSLDSGGLPGDGTNLQSGQERTLTSADNPGFGPWLLNHLNTHNPWMSTLGGYDVKDFVSAVSDTFPKNYVVIATGGFSVRTVGSKNGSGVWTNSGSSITATGLNGDSLTSQVSNGSPTSGATLNLRVTGNSWALHHSITYTP